MAAGVACVVGGAGVSGGTARVSAVSGAAVAGAASPTWAARIGGRLGTATTAAATTSGAAGLARTGPGAAV
jgi:hypothetical protein